MARTKTNKGLGYNRHKLHYNSDFKWQVCHEYLIGNGIELSEKRLQLLRSNQKSEPFLGKLVCSCNSVGQGNLENAIKGGCTDFAQLCQKTGARTVC